MMRPRFAKTFAHKREGAGKTGCALHPRSRVQCAQGSAHTSIQVQRRASGLPCAMALRLMPCSPRRRIRLVTVADGSRFCQTRLGYQNLRQLDTSNGCQDHTVLPYAPASFVCAPSYAHKPSARPAKTIARPTLPRPPHPAPYVRDDRDTPLLWGRDGAVCRAVSTKSPRGIFS